MHHSLFRRVIIEQIVFAALLAIAAVLIALLFVSQTVNRSARVEIEAEYRALERRYDELGVVAFSDEIDYRVYNERENDLLHVYLLVRSDKSTVIGNLDYWPSGLDIEPGWKRFDATSAGASPGAVLAKVEVIDDKFPVIVGRRLAIYDVLHWKFIPSIAVLALLVSVLAVSSTYRIARRFRSRIDSFNDVFSRVRMGSVDARIPSAVFTRAQDDELDQLADSINEALDEIAGLFRKLNDVSQISAHELNKEVERLYRTAQKSGDQSMVEGAKSLMALLREILELSNISTSSRRDVSRIDLRDCVHEAAELFSDVYEDKNIALNLTLPDTPAEILGKAPLVTNALANLLDNALKFTPEGRGVSVSIEQESSTVKIIVSDQGPGVATTDLMRLSNNASGKTETGYGYGLRFVQAVAIRHGATLHLENTEPGLSVHLTFRQI